MEGTLYYHSAPLVRLARPCIIICFITSSGYFSKSETRLTIHVHISIYIYIYVHIYVSLIVNVDFSILIHILIHSFIHSFIHPFIYSFDTLCDQLHYCGGKVNELMRDTKFLDMETKRYDSLLKQANRKWGKFYHHHYHYPYIHLSA